MKHIGCLVLVLVVVAAGFFALVTLVFNQTDDQSALTEQVSGKPTDVTERSGAGTDNSYYEVVYTYRFEGRTFAHQTEIVVDYWEPGSPLIVCLDPDQPTEHVIRVDAANRCGSEYIRGGPIESSTPAA